MYWILLYRNFRSDRRHIGAGFMLKKSAPLCHINSSSSTHSRFKTSIEAGRKIATGASPGCVFLLIFVNSSCHHCLNIFFIPDIWFIFFFQFSTILCFFLLFLRPLFLIC